jgi:multidrug efflux pump subunit AcrB
MSGAFNLSEWALKRRALVWFALILIVVTGVVSYFGLGRNEDPPFTIKTMIVQANWPGAPVDDMLRQVTDRLEKKLQEVPYLDFLRSYTTAGRTIVFVNLEGSTPAKAIPDVWYQVRKKIADIQYTFPSGVQGPFFDDEFGETFGIIYAFTADGFSQRELRDYVEDVRSELLSVENVSKIETVGVQEEKIYIEFSVQRLAGLGLDRMALINALTAQNAVTPAGVVETGEQKILIRVTGAFETEEDIRKVNFAANGKLFRLADLATVTRGYADPPEPLFRVNGKPAIGLAISMQAGGDLLALGRAVEEKMRDILTRLPIGIEPILVAEQPHVVDEAVSEFTKSLWEAIAIVLAVSFLSLGLRAGAVVACSIPLVLAGVFVSMEYLGIDLQRVSLGALIIALGLLVDDAMITVEMMITKLEEGLSKVEAATFAYTSTAFPMLTGTLVTVAGFIPIGFAKSGAGEYTFSMFAVIAVALMISWIVAVVFAPLIGVTILKQPKQTPHHKVRRGVFLRMFHGVLVTAMRLRWLTIAATIALFALALAGMRIVPEQFFPSSDRPELVVDLQVPENASIFATDTAARKLDEILAGDKEIDHWTTNVGAGAVRFYLPLDPKLRNDFFAQAVVVTKGLEERARVQARLEASLAEALPEAVVRVSPLELGPPVGWPLQFRVSGPDPSQVRTIAYRVADTVGGNPYTRQINFDWIEPSRMLRIHVDQDQARLVGLSSEALAQSVQTAISGVTVTQVRDDIYLVDVVARAQAQDRTSPWTVRTLQIPLPSGKTIPLAQLATVEYSLEPPLIWRRDRLPTLTVQADAAGGAQPADIVDALRPDIEKLNAELPSGYLVSIGGTAEESAKSRASVFAAAPLMVLAMLVVLMMQMQSFAKLALVLSVAPLGIIGVVAALLLSGRPLGFIAILGVIALVGMIVRNSVILVDQIDTEIAHGRTRWDAVVEATVHRFRPILLTAAAAILGMIPIAPTVFWGPMAFAIMGGLAIATLLTLIFLPALYVVWFRIRENEGTETEPLVAEQALTA